MEYRCEATSVAGFVQQLAVAYVGRGYIFYVTGEIPEKKDPRVVDAKLVQMECRRRGHLERRRKKTDIDLGQLRDHGIARRVDVLAA